MRILAFQHSDIDHGGIFREFLADDGHEYHGVNVSNADSLPPIEDYDALWVFGGAMNVWEEDKHPWLVAEKDYIRDAVMEKGVPYLGICLGHQLLADALGGQVEKAKSPEVGVMEVQLTEAGASGVLLDGFPEVFDVLQWHGAEIVKLPAGAQVLASSQNCPVQAMKWGTRAASTQFHMEVDRDLASGWNGLPACHAALTGVLGDGGDDRFFAAIDDQLTDFNKLAERFYINWLQMTART